MPSKPQISAACVTLAAIVAWHHAGPARADEDAVRRGGQEIWRTTRNCGINCLYLYLKLHGIRADYKNIAETVPIGPQGTGLIDLREAAESRGAGVILMKSTPDDLPKLPKPLIAHMDRPEGEGGHYVVILAVNAANVEVIDGSSAARQWIKTDEFRRRWSGYLLGPRAGIDMKAWALVSIGCVIGYVAVSTPWRARARGAMLWHNLPRVAGPR